MLDDTGTSLRDVTFVVVDLETTGGSSREEAITEIGAVKVRGGEVLGELATLVDPERGIPPQITVLTGISDSMVVGAPRIGEAFSSFLEFARGCVLVAHNAPFDIGFLQAAARELRVPWPGFTVVDTVRLARAVVTREEVHDHRLSTLARHFRSPVEPVHRALADARATVHVLHALLGRIGSLGVRTLEELVAWSHAVPEDVRRKRHLAEGLPAGPGVYVFRDAQGKALYVGTSRDVRARVRSYFTASETRPRMRDMVRLAERVDVVRCATALEAAVRELRLIASEQPRYNRRSRQPRRALWLGLTDEAFPRVTLVREPARDGPWIGPFSSVLQAEQARDALHEAVRLRRCTRRVGPRSRSSPCPLHDMGRCGAPCDGSESREAYARHVAFTVEVLRGDPRPVHSAAETRMARLVQQLRFEEAAVHRDRAAAFLRGHGRAADTQGLVTCGQVVAARATGAGGWELACIRSGRLAAAALCRRGQPVQAVIDAMVATAETVRPRAGPSPAALPEETALLLRWLTGADGGPAARLVSVERPWWQPLRSVGGP